MNFPIESLNLMMLNVGYAEHYADWNWQNVSSPFTRIFYVTEGEATIHFSNHSVQLTPNHIYLVPAWTLHSYECHGRFCLYYLHVYETYKHDTDIFELFQFPDEVSAEEYVPTLFQRMCRQHPYSALSESNPNTYDNNHTFTRNIHRYNDMPLHQKMQLRGSLLMLISLLLEHAEPRLWTQNQRMKRIIDFIHTHLYTDIDIDSLSDHANVSKPYLIRLFNQHFHTSPLQYINRKKIERAQLALITEDLTVQEIAYTLGFSDPSYFIRLFKKITGVTPNEYRKTMR